MDIGKSISFVFEDEKWVQKVLIGGLVVLATIILSITVIGGIIGAAILMGYMVDLIRNVRRGDANALPEWDDWGDKTVKGLKLLALYFIWALPLILVALPLAVFSNLSESSGDASFFFGLLIACFGCLAVIYGIFVALLQPAITVRFAETNEFSSGLNVRDIWNFTRENIAEVIIVVIVVWAVQLIAAIVGSILCGVGLLFTTFWAYLVQGHLFGQIGLKKAGTNLGSAPKYDITPDDVMPGVGELVDDVQSGVDDAFESLPDVDVNIG